ncbi:MAG: phosphoglycerate mutase family protein, partial [Thermodesulfobacteriota bacterium]
MIRHGETSLNQKQGTMRGWLNVPLTPRGHKEAQK